MPTIYFTVVNILCFILLHYILKKKGRSIRGLIDFHSERLLQDILFGFLWLFVLYVPFMIAVMGTMFVMFGTDFTNHFQTVFVGNAEAYSYVRPGWLIWFTALVSLVFPS